MPLYHLRCAGCGRTDKKLTPNPVKDPETTCSCGGVMKRAAKGPATRVMEKLDNGIMPRAVERDSDAERLMAERADGADFLAGGAQRRSD